jgi:hypothetical protein
MIKLSDLIKEEKQEQYVPYMYSPVGFSCNVCRFYYVKDNKHMCANKDYQKYMGTAELLDNDKNPIKDPTKWCSNWFKPVQND